MDLFDCIARASIDRLIEQLGLTPKNRTDAYERLAVALRAGSVHLYEALARHDQRVSELLQVINREVLLRRNASAACEKLVDEILHLRNEIEATAAALAAAQNRAEKAEAELAQLRVDLACAQDDHE